MWSLPRVLAIVTAVVLLGCAPDDVLGPRVAPGVAVTDANAAKSVETSAKVYCNGSTCYAAAFEFTDFQSYTIFTATLQNLQGTYPPGGPSTVQKLNWFEFRFFDEPIGNDYIIADAAFRSFVTVGNVEVGNHNNWINNANVGGPLVESFSTTGYGIVGCSGGAFLDDFHFRTCPSQGLDGWVKVGFKLSHAGLKPSKSPVRFRDFRFSFGAGGTVCSTGFGLPGTCTESSYRQAMRN